MEIVSNSTIYASGAYYDYSASLITLSHEQYNSGVLMHEHRREVAREMGLYDARKLKQDPEKVSFVGALGEIPIFLTYSDVLNSFDPYIGLSTADFVYNGKYGGDVKTSERHSNLFINEKHWQQHPNWLYVAVQREAENDYRLIGYCRGADVPKLGDYMNPHGRGWGYRVKRMYLRPFRRLIGEKMEKRRK